MSEVDRIKEEIGWLKVTFAIFVAVDVSMIGWAAQNYTSASVLLLSLITVAVAIVTIVIIVINRRAYKKINRLEDL